MKIDGKFPGIDENCRKSPGNCRESQEITVESQGIASYTIFV